MKLENGPKIPIPGAAGTAIFAALQGLAVLCGDGRLTIEKKRVPGGGYSYWVSNIITPDKQSPR